MKEIFKSELTLSQNGFLFDHGSGLTYTLNPTGQYIFRKIEEGKQAPGILRLLINEFDVSEETARKDIDDFYRQLKEAGLID